MIQRRAMKRGKVIGAIVLVGAIAVVIAWRLGGPAGDATESNTGAGETASSGPPGSSSGAAAGLPDGVGLADGEVRVYRVDSAQSEVYWRIYRAGAFSRLGHNHVISIGDLEGTVSLDRDLSATEWTLRFPVQALVIDDPVLRARYGEDFESVPSEQDKDGTKTNMMTDRVLNGEVFTEIRLTGTGVDGTLENAELPLAVRLLGRTIEQSFPASITIEADTLTVEGEYRLTHADLGMEPFSAFGGAIAVGDDIDFSYRIHAVAGRQ
jgi:hypothetical protein